MCGTMGDSSSVSDSSARRITDAVSAGPPPAGMAVMALKSSITALMAVLK